MLILQLQPNNRRSGNGRGNGRGNGKGRGRGRGRGKGKVNGFANGASNSSDNSKIIIPSSSFHVEEGEDAISSSTGLKKGKKCDSSDSSDYDDDDNDADYTGIEDFANSFVSDDTQLHTIDRKFAKDSQFAEKFREIDEQFNSVVLGMATMESIVTCRNDDLKMKYEQKKASFEVLGIPTTELTLYYNSYSGNSQSVLWNIVKRHFKPLRNHDGRTDFGKGVYLFTRPELSRAKDQGVVICKVLVGKTHRVKGKKGNSEPIPEGHHAKFVDFGGNKNSFYVLTNPDQILPMAVIHCGADSGWSPGTRDSPGTQNQNPQEIRDRINKEMANIFKESLKWHLTGKYMQACQAITTRLYPHQMYALAWMANRENEPKIEFKGGILADDMGLGKTLTVLSLIMTNFHDKRPLAKPMPGNIRRLTKETLRYLPLANLKDGKDSNGLGARAKTRDFRRKDTKGKVKGSKRKYCEEAYFMVNEAEGIERNDSLLESSVLLKAANEEDKDEFDSLIDSKGSYSERLGLDASSSIFHKEKRQKFFDDLSDDEEYQQMTEEERNEKMAPKLNQLDGAVSCSSDEDEDAITSSSEVKVKVTKKFVVKDESDDDDMPEIGQSASPDDSEDDALNFDLYENEDTNEDDKALVKTEEIHDDFQLTEAQRKNMIVPPKMPAILNSRRRATLIVTPSSLIGHWLEQIQRHVENSVPLSIFVHHGTNKTMLATELQDHDIVLTTYGTLQSELNDFNMGPLLKAKWLRVCLDEGHYIKNHRSKTAKAAKNLDAKRKWIISGTPIQNNLNELYALLFWLEEPTYGMAVQAKFKKQIETPVKEGLIKGVHRLQLLVQAICLRRTKTDEIEPGRPLVHLPKKEITIQELEFSREERVFYDAFHDNAKKIVERYMRKKTLLKNYAHIFAVMMRLRQLCCHRELLSEISWKNVKFDDIEEIVREMTQGDAEENMEDAERAKALAERLRDMIRDGISDECSICLSDFNHPVITPCAHIYCRPCIVQLIETIPRPPAPCPLCRGPLEIRGLMEAAKSEDDNAGEEGDAADKDFENIVVECSSTKVNAALTHLEKIRQTKPKDKVIIVSQFTSLLSILQPLLNDHNFKWTRLDGSMTTRKRAEVIANFQDTSADAPTVLLLSLRAGGVGLNLNVANHMLLLDPAWNPSTEDQCFDRIHRLGQTKEVEITRFVMKNS